MVTGRPLFQFSVATGLKVVTGFCIVVSLVVWHPFFGAMLSSLVVGSWWSYAAVRAGRRKLAYYLAAWPMGVVAFVVGCWLLLWESMHGQPDFEEFVFPLAMMCLASLSTLVLLRRLIRRPGFGAAAKVGVFAVYNTSAMFVILTALCEAVAEWMSGRESLLDILVASPMLLVGVFGSAVWATLLMPLAWPISIWFCSILRCIDPGEVQEPELSAISRSVLEVVETWRADEDGPLGAAELAERLGIDTITAAEHLEILHGRKMIEKTGPDHYHRIGSQEGVASPVSSREVDPTGPT